jgi:hypothetical protein
MLPALSYLTNHKKSLFWLPSCALCRLLRGIVRPQLLYNWPKEQLHLLNVPPYHMCMQAAAWQCAAAAAVQLAQGTTAPAKRSTLPYVYAGCCLAM